MGRWRRWMAEEQKETRPSRRERMNVDRESRTRRADQRTERVKEDSTVSWSV